MIGTIAAAFILSFFLSFTDFGIPASIGGQYTVVATQLYMVMMGAVPDFQSGSAIAVIMLIPSIVAVWLLRFTERFNFRYNKISTFELADDKVRDGFFAAVYVVVIAAIFAIFAIMFIVPFIKSWPYQVVFTTETLQRILSDRSIETVYTNSVMVAAATAVIGTVLPTWPPWSTPVPASRRLQDAHGRLRHGDEYRSRHGPRRGILVCLYGLANSEHLHHHYPAEFGPRIYDAVPHDSGLPV